ncbi:hypothetical protein [Sphingomonas mollis]|uniref:DUF4154 domain-containing protein n=1 Tax=Sphingomonas mollis TaxID=2795726 RepID=A0ABS0XTZ9_9SPHN|nr:hypothetical protein [Sphingomonas sp. BT553]MBJ6123523.1 hypothetical protein [Sphingomonas sp. BT553]
MRHHAVEPLVTKRCIHRSSRLGQATTEQGNSEGVPLLYRPTFWRSAAALVLMTGTPLPLWAELNTPIAARVLTFLLPAPKGPMQAAIIFNPDNAASIADALAIEHAIGSGMPVGNTVIRTRRIATTTLDGLRGYRAAFVTAGLRKEQEAIAAAAIRNSVVTITSDLACVQAGRCVVGIGSGPHTQITVSRAASRAVGARFGSAFLMLVKEI